MEAYKHGGHFSLFSIFPPYPVEKSRFRQNEANHFIRLGTWSRLAQLATGASFGLAAPASADLLRVEWSPRLRPGGIG
jgi:hypothetical protein